MRLGLEAKPEIELERRRAEEKIFYWRRKVNDPMISHRDSITAARYMENAYRILRAKTDSDCG